MRLALPRRLKILGVLGAAFLGIALGPFASPALATQYIFPVIGGYSFQDDFNAGRASGPHHAIDIIANKGQQIVSATDGTITFVANPEPSWGYAVFVRSTGGYTYMYLHINNDNPGTDDGAGGPMHAYAPDVAVGNHVVRGQRLGTVGDSGNAENTVSHLHFEVHDANDNAVNPYNNLRGAQHIGAPVSYPALSGEVLPYGATYNKGVHVAMGNVDADSASEYATGAGNGAGPRVRLYDSNNQYLGYNFYAFGSSQRGGVDVALGDVDGDGKAEVIAGDGPGYSPHVAVYKLGASGSVTKLADFLALGSGFRGGVHVAAADTTGDGKAEIIVGAGGGGGPRVSVFKADGTQLKTFYPYDQGFKGGVDVAAGDVTGTTGAEIVTVPGYGGSSRVQVFDGNTLTRLANWYAYGTGYNLGVHISVGNVRTGTAKSEILAGADNGGSPRLRLFDYQGNNLQDKTYLPESWWRGYFDVGAGSGTSKAATGVNRRGSVRTGI